MSWRDVHVTVPFHDVVNWTSFSFPWRLHPLIHCFCLRWRMDRCHVTDTISQIFPYHPYLFHQPIAMLLCLFQLLDCFSHWKINPWLLLPVVLNWCTCHWSHFVDYRHADAGCYFWPCCYFFPQVITQVSTVITPIAILCIYGRSCECCKPFLAFFWVFFIIFNATAPIIMRRKLQRERTIYHLQNNM